MPHSPHRGEQARAPRRICRLRRQTGSGTSRRIFCPTGRKQTLRTTIDAKTYIIVKPRRVSRRARREKILIINRRDMRVAIYSSRAAVHRRGITIPAPFRARQSCHFLETGSLHPPLAALRLFPLLGLSPRQEPPCGGCAPKRACGRSPAHPLHPQGVCGIRKAVQPLTAALPYRRGEFTTLSAVSTLF